MMFANLDGKLVAPELIKYVDYSDITSDGVVVTLVNGEIYNVTGFPALELVWMFRPSALEGDNRIKWKKHAWWVHNIFAHPIMQLLAWCHLYKQAIWIHDVTVPKPIGFK